MKYDGKIIISWQAGSSEILTSAKGCDVDMINALSESTIAILNNASVLGLRGKELRDVYIAHLIKSVAYTNLKRQTSEYVQTYAVET